jgi:hypothetical protein
MSRSSANASSREPGALSAMLDMAKVVIYDNEYAQVTQTLRQRPGDTQAGGARVPILSQALTDTLNVAGRDDVAHATSRPQPYAIQQSQTAADLLRAEGTPRVDVSYGRGSIVRGTLMSRDHCGGILVRADDTGVMTHIPGPLSIAFLESGGDTAEAGSSVLVDSKLAVLQLSYLTEGLSWQPIYIGTLRRGSDGEVQLDLILRANIANDTGLAFRPAALQLVSGSVRPPGVSYSVPSRMRRMKSMSENSGATAALMSHSVGNADGDGYGRSRPSPSVGSKTYLGDGGYSIYHVEEAVQLRATTQVHLQSYTDIATEMVLCLDLPTSGSVEGPLGVAPKEGYRKLEFAYQFRLANRATSDASPDRMLPRGNVALFEAHGADDLVGTFIGSSSIPSTPAGRLVRLTVGDSDRLRQASVSREEPVGTAPHPSRENYSLVTTKTTVELYVQGRVDKPTRVLLEHPSEWMQTDAAIPPAVVTLRGSTDKTSTKLPTSTGPSGAQEWVFLLHPGVDLHVCTIVAKTTSMQYIGESKVSKSRALSRRISAAASEALAVSSKATSSSKGKAAAQETSEEGD